MEGLRKIFKDSSECTEPDFMEDWAIECLVRAKLDYSTIRELRKVCKKWRKFFSDDDNGILAMRRARDLQQPSLFLIPCGYPSAVTRRSEFTCATYKSNILILGGRRRYETLSDLWVIDTLNGEVRRETNMSTARQLCAAAAVGDSVFAIGGESFKGWSYDDAKATVERYDSAKKEWSYVSSLPYRTMPSRCYVDAFSSSKEPTLFVTGDSYDGRKKMDGAYSYSMSNDIWEQVDVTSYQSLVHPRPLKWMWCTGTMLFTKRMIYKEGGAHVVSDQAAAAAWQFPSEITIPADVATALIQPTNGSATDQNPLISDSLTKKSMLFLEEENQTRSAITSVTVVPSNAEFHPLSVISRVENTSIVANVVPMNFIRDDMFFQKLTKDPNERLFSCLFAVVFF